MMKPMAKRLVIRALIHEGCSKVSERGIHEKWRCPPGCAEHTTSVPRHDVVTVGVIRNIIRDLACLPKGWLQ
jgi:predicted RNA binding protein YcfA (HicA-like mRNA interferase family)